MSCGEADYATSVTSLKSVPAVDDMEGDKALSSCNVSICDIEYFPRWDKGIGNSNGKNPALYLSQEI